jgi:hypothetical protein
MLLRRWSESIAAVSVRQPSGDAYRCYEYPEAAAWYGEVTEVKTPSFSSFLVHTL